MEQCGNPFNGFTKTSEYLVCIDSDGCAMDTMDIKHYKCFGPCMVEEWGLEKWKDKVLFRWNQVNLYSMTRGINRFKALALVLAEVNEKYSCIPDVETLITWSDESEQLSNDWLAESARKIESICLKKALHWSRRVNEEIEALPQDCKVPFPGAKEGISRIHQYADIAIVSSANPDAVEMEWGSHEMLQDVDILLAQNAGSKAFCIKRLLEYGYDNNHVLMVGDAPGDRQAAFKNEVFFYPILVAREFESWKKLPDGVERLIKGEFTKDYQQQLSDEFEKNLHA